MRPGRGTSEPAEAVNDADVPPSTTPPSPLLFHVEALL